MGNGNDGAWHWLVTGVFRWFESRGIGQKPELEGLRVTSGEEIIANTTVVLTPCLAPSKHLTCLASFNPHNNLVMKPRHREVKCLA